MHRYQAFLHQCVWTWRTGRHPGIQTDTIIDASITGMNEAAIHEPIEEIQQTYLKLHPMVVDRMHSIIKILQSL